MGFGTSVMLFSPCEVSESFLVARISVTGMFRQARDPVRESTDLWYAGVRVEFTGQGPTGKIVLMLRVGKQERKLRFDEGCDIQWSGNMCVSSLSPREIC